MKSFIEFFEISYQVPIKWLTLSKILANIMKLLQLIIIKTLKKTLGLKEIVNIYTSNSGKPVI